MAEGSAMGQDPVRTFDGFWTLREYYRDRDPTLRIHTRDDRLYTVQLTETRDPFDRLDGYAHGDEARLVRVVDDDADDNPYGLEAGDETVVFRRRGYHRRSPDAVADGLPLDRKRQTVVGLEVTTGD